MVWEAGMWEMILALAIAASLTGLARWLIRGSSEEAIGLHLILLPVALSMVTCVSRPVMAGWVLVGLAVFVLANRQRRAREERPGMEPEGRPSRRPRHYRWI